MKRFVTSLLFIFLLWFAIDRVGELGLSWLNRHSHDTTSPKIRHITNGVSEDVIMMGTSRCNGHYVPSIISETLGMSVYNAGIDGSDNIFAQYMALCYILQKHTPKVICLEVQNSFLEKEEESFKTTGYFAPYFGQCASADSVFLQTGSFWLYKLSHLYRYNTIVLANITGQVKNYWNHAENGYIPNPEPEVFPETTVWETEHVDISEEKRDYMERFVQICRKKHIFLCFVISPACSKVDNSFYSCLRNFANTHQTPLLDYHTEGLYVNNPDYFKDNFHLWDKGARLYSFVFAKDLQKLVSKNL